MISHYALILGRIRECSRSPMRRGVLLHAQGSRISYFAHVRRGSSRSNATCTKEEALSGIEGSPRKDPNGEDLVIWPSSIRIAHLARRVETLDFFGRGQMVPDLSRLHSTWKSAKPVE